jgi:hypothetical protein
MGEGNYYSNVPPARHPENTMPTSEAFIRGIIVITRYTDIGTS